MKKKIVILGAGFAGLATGYELAKKGYNVTILEEQDYEGGLCVTFEKNGYLFDVGGHRLYTKSEEIFNFLNDLLGKESYIERQRISRIYMNKKFFEYPLKLFNVITNQKLWNIIKIIVDVLYLQIVNIFNKKSLSDDCNFEEWIVKRFGKTLYNIYFKVYTEKVWKESPRDLHCELAARRISFTNISQIITRLLGFGKKEAPRTYITDLYYPKYGIGEIAKGLLNKFKKEKGEIIYNVNLTEIGIEKNKKIDFITYNNGKNESIKIEADYFLSTIPLTFLIGLLQKDKHVSLEKSISSRLKYKSIYCVYLMVDSEPTFPDTWLYIPEPKFIVFRIVNYSNWSPYMAPKGKSSVCLEISLDKDAKMSHEELYERAISDVEELGLMSRDIVEGYFVKFFPYAYPIYHNDYKQVLSKIDIEMKEFKNLLTFGRQGAFNYTTMDNTLRSGIEVAKHIATVSGNGKSSIYDEKFSLLNNKFQELD